MNFKVGDEVVYVGYDGSDKISAAKYKIKAASLVRGQHYFIRAFDWRNGIMLEGQINGCWPNGVEAAWNPRAFRKIEPRAIEQFRTMCKSKKPLVPIE